MLYKEFIRNQIIKLVEFQINLLKKVEEEIVKLFFKTFYLNEIFYNNT